MQFVLNLKFVRNSERKCKKISIEMQTTREQKDVVSDYEIFSKIISNKLNLFYTIKIKNNFSSEWNYSAEKKKTSAHEVGSIVLGILRNYVGKNKKLHNMCICNIYVLPVKFYDCLTFSCLRLNTFH